ncbi:IS66 family transposase [Bradyrhizobium tropiciagri]|uniref:IS66 family transposase n=1 Tax=Bradyrhizobium tropiciagri TaxID=312253 RepID=UPI001FCCD36A|nr:IS66 family transposase [Bradyrhizobium tropiciagri]
MLDVIPAMLLCGRSIPVRLPQLHRWVHAKAPMPDLEWYGLDGTREPHGGLEVRLVSAAVPAGADPDRPGIQLDGATLAGWVKRATWWLKSLYELQLRMIQAAPRLFCDETSMPMLDPGRHFLAHAMNDRPWGGPSPPAVAYLFAKGCGTEEIAEQLTGFSGVLQVDAYAAYKALPRHHGGVIQLAIFFRPCPTPFAREVIERLQAVYAIEAEIRGSRAEQWLAARRTRSAPLMAALKIRLTELVGQLFSQSKLTEAINYALNLWDRLTLFLRDGRVEVDSNTVERSMRPIAMG